MAITLGKLCANVGNTYGMKLLAGAAGLDNFVRWVHMIEDSEVPSFLHGHELVFTTGIAQTGNDWMLEFATSMLGKNASGLVLNLGPYIKDVPDNVIKFCEENSLPLFTVPWSVRLIDITYDFCHRIIATEDIETGVATAMRNLIFMPGEEKVYKPTLERRCFYPDSLYSVVALEQVYQEGNAPGEDENRNFKLQAERLLLKSGKQFSLFFYDKKLIVILQDFSEAQIDEFIDDFQSYYERLKVRYKLRAGVSPTGKGYSAISEGYNKAYMGLKIARLQNRKIVRYQTMGLYKLIVSVNDNEILDELYTETLGILEECDQKNGTDYMNTLRCYLEHNSSVQEVAKITYVHRNTVNYKIKKIREILKCEFDYEHKLKLMLAFFIKDLLIERG